jgi:radical SAM superfamily enzyme YgiQ (UPF0313 family)
MSQIILIAPAFGDTLVNVFNVGLLSIASFLESKGVDVIIFHKKKDYENKLLEYLSKSEVMLVGISMMTVQYSEGEEIAKKIKNINPTLPIVVGGIHVKIFPQKTLSCKYFDIAVTGDGEQTMFEIFDAFKNNRNISLIKGIGFKDQHGMHWTSPAERFDLNLLPQLNYSLIYNFGPNKWYDSQKSMYVFSGTGCGNKCTFCINSIYGTKRRLRPIIQVVNEIEYLIKNYNISHIYVLDEDFSREKRRFLEFLDLCEHRNLHFDFFFQSKADVIADGYLGIEVLKRIRHIGCKYILLGIESGSDRMRKLINKKLSSDQAIRSIKSILEAGITPWITLMIGMPDENIEDYYATFRLMWGIKNLSKNYPQGVAMDVPALYRPIAGSLMYKRALAYYPKGNKIDFSQQDHFVNSNKPTSLQLLECNYPWIQDRQELYKILSCMERYFKYYSGFSGFRKKISDGILFFIPGYRKKLILTNRNPEALNPLLFLELKSILKETE